MQSQQEDERSLTQILLETLDVYQQKWEEYVFIVTALTCGKCRIVTIQDTEPKAAEPLDNMRIDDDEDLKPVVKYKCM